MNTVESKPQAEWRETTIAPAGVETTYPGKELVGSGLAYWIGKERGMPTFYVPTHMLSGYAASSATFYSEEMCQQFIVELEPLMNWNQPLSTLAKDPAYRPDTFNALAKKFWIEDAAATAGGGRW